MWLKARWKTWPALHSAPVVARPWHSSILWMRTCYERCRNDLRPSRAAGAALDAFPPDRLAGGELPGDRIDGRCHVAVPRSAADGRCDAQPARLCQLASVGPAQSAVGPDGRRTTDTAALPARGARRAR